MSRHHECIFTSKVYNQLRSDGKKKSGVVLTDPPTTYIGKLYAELEEKWANKRVSQCDDPIPMNGGDPTPMNGGDPIPDTRGDSNEFWDLKTGGDTTGMWFELGNRRVQRHFLGRRCNRLSKRFTVYGVIGSGSFGVVFAAREKMTGRHFAIKVMEAVNEKRQQDRVPKERSNWIVLFPELIDRAFDRWTAREAHVGLLFLDEPEFSQIDSVYLHPPLLSIVMDQFAVINRPEMETLPKLILGDYNHELNTWSPDKRFKSVTGEDCTGGDNKSTMLSEKKVCKVSFYLVAALLALLDRNMTHLDWSARNYLVDENCHAKTIDLDQTGLAIDLSGDFVQNSQSCIISWEVFVLPEVALHLTYYPNIAFFADADQVSNRVRVRHDTRGTQLEHLGCAAFEMLHGFAPWEHAEQLVDDLTTQDIGRGTKVSRWYSMDEAGVEFNEEKKRRRERIINDDLQIMDVQQLDRDFNPEREYNQVGQDCVDVLRSMLSKEVEDRPTILELCSFPWFQGWWADQNPDEFLRGTPAGFGPTNDDPDSKTGQASAVQGGPVIPGGPPSQGGPSTQGGPPTQGGPTKAKGKGKGKGPTPSSKTAPQDTELTDALYMLNLPHFPLAISDATGQAQLRTWREYISQLALALLDSNSLPAADLKRLLTLDRGAIPPPRTLAQARKLALDHVSKKIDENLSEVYRSFCLLALSYYSVRNVHFSQMPGKHHNPFAHKTPEEQSMGRGALLQFLNGPNFVLPTPPRERLRNIRERLRNNPELLEGRPKRKVRLPQDDGPVHPPPPPPDTLELGQKRKIREVLGAEALAVKRRELASCYWQGYTKWQNEMKSCRARGRRTGPKRATYRAWGALLPQESLVKK